MRKGLAVAVLVGLIACERSELPAPAEKRAQSLEVDSAPALVLVATTPGSRQTEVVVSRGSDLLDSIATVEHAPGGELRAAVLPGATALVAVVDLERQRDLSWASSLLLVEPDKPPSVLADRVFYASRPVVLRDGRVLVERGVAGEEPSQRDALRTDALSIDAIEPWTGALTTLHTYSGYTTHLAGVYGDEALVYRVSHRHADLVAVHVETGALRVLADEIPAFARDFSTAEGALVYANRDADGWVVERLDLATLERGVIFRAHGMSVTPHVWFGGSVVVNDGSGARALDGSLERPLGEGFDELRVLTPTHAAFLHRVPGRLPVPFVVTPEGVASVVLVPDGKRVDVVGVLP